MIQKEEFYFGSRDGAHKLHAVKWIPETEKPVCILQIVHGMTEHIGRYENFALAMAKKESLWWVTITLDMAYPYPRVNPWGIFARMMRPPFWCGMNTG